MPLNTASPQTVRPAATANYWNVTGIDIDEPSDRITIRYEYGTKDTDDTITYLDRQAGYITKASAYAALKPNGSKSWRQNLKVMAYFILQNEGVIPAGTIT